MTEADFKVIGSLDSATLVRGWVTLNSYGWPGWLVSPAPPPEKDSTELRTELMRAIAGCVGIRACVREWHREFMDDEEFSVWWRSNRAYFESKQATT